eukprot:377416-Pyramimonas_sp.AAC.1
MWKEDPSWGSLQVRESKRIAHLQTQTRRYRWMMECQLLKEFPDEEYVHHLMKSKLATKGMHKPNPEAPKEPKWSLVKIFEDEMTDTKQQIAETAWELDIPVGVHSKEQAGIVAAGMKHLVLESTETCNPEDWAEEEPAGDDGSHAEGTGKGEGKDNDRRKRR